jgi:hypothetical protein
MGKYNVKNVSLDPKYEEMFCESINYFKGAKTVHEVVEMQQHQNLANTVCN